MSCPGVDIGESRQASFDAAKDAFGIQQKYGFLHIESLALLDAMISQGVRASAFGNHGHDGRVETLAQLLNQIQELVL